MVNSVTPTATNAAAVSAAAGDKKTLNQNFDQFLLLLTTQLKNQDPLSPMDSAQFTDQLVSFSQVEQQIKTNDNLTKLVNLSNTSQTTLGLSYIGLNVDIHGDQFEYAGTGTTVMNYTLPSDAALSTINVLDANNNMVYSQKGELSSGKHGFSWNGLDQNGQQAPAGVYHLRVGALDVAQKSMTADTVVPGFVTGITKDADGTINLIVGKTSPQTVPMSEVTQAAL